MRYLEVLLAPLMAIAVMGQSMLERQLRQQLNTSAENIANLPFNTSSALFLNASTSTPPRGSRRKLSFMFGTRITTTLLPPPSINSSTTTDRTLPLRSVTATLQLSNETKTELQTVDDDTSRVEALLKDENLLIFTTQSSNIQLTASMSRKPFNSTTRPPNRTGLKSAVEKFVPKPQSQHVFQPLRLSNKTAIVQPMDKNAVKIVPNYQNKIKSIHDKNELDPELNELRKRIAIGIAARKLLRERLKQASATRLQTTNIQKVFNPIRSKINGVSRKKTGIAAKQSGVRTSLADEKRRSEGRIHDANGHIRTGRAGSPSPVIAKRFHNEDASLPEFKQQVQVEPSKVQTETDLVSKLRALSAGPSVQIDDEHLHDGMRQTTKLKTFHNQKDRSNAPVELQHKPAFCRRCYRFWRNVSTAKINKSAIYQYCCTIGNNKGELFKQFRQTVSIRR